MEEVERRQSGKVVAKQNAKDQDCIKARPVFIASIVYYVILYYAILYCILFYYIIV